MTNSCIETGGHIGAGGYRYKWKDGAPRRLHRIVLAEKLGRAIQPGMMALHTCDNPGCVNPEHLYEGTPAQNTADMHARGRAPRGTSHGMAKFSADQVRAIRALQGALPSRAVAKMFSTHAPTICRIWNGIGYKDVSP